MSAEARLPPIFADWFASRGWSPREHQLALLEKARAGKSSLLIAPTGGGKTLAGFLPTLVELYEASQRVPLPTRALARGGEGLGVGALHLRSQQVPPPPTPPHHSLRERGEGRSGASFQREETFAARAACIRCTSRH